MSDALRLLALTVFAWDAGGVSFILWRWSRGIPPDRRRLLFRHVLAVSTFSLISLATFAAQVVARFGQPLVWYVTPLSLAAGIVLAVALQELGKWVGSRTIAHGAPGDPGYLG